MRLKEITKLYAGTTEDIIQIRWKGNVYRYTAEELFDMGSVPLTNRMVSSISVVNNELHITVA